MKRFGRKNNGAVVEMTVPEIEDYLHDILEATEIMNDQSNGFYANVEEFLGGILEELQAIRECLNRDREEAHSAAEEKADVEENYTPPF